MTPPGVPLFKPTIVTDGGPWATHNMPCAVCVSRVAVYNVGTGRFQPCWECQHRGWQTIRRWGVVKRETA